MKKLLHHPHLANWIFFGIGCVWIILGFIDAPNWARAILLGFFCINVLSKLKW